MCKNIRIDLGFFVVQVLVSIIVLSFCLYEIVINNSNATITSIYLPVITAILGYWLPSPVTQHISKAETPQTSETSETRQIPRTLETRQIPRTLEIPQTSTPELSTLSIQSPQETIPNVIQLNNPISLNNLPQLIATEPEKQGPSPTYGNSQIVASIGANNV